MSDAQSNSNSNSTKQNKDKTQKQTVSIININNRGPAIISQIATGRNHVLALDTKGNVYAWGNNKFG